METSNVYNAKHYIRYSRGGYDFLRTGEIGRGRYPEAEDEIAALHMNSPQLGA
jgi:hypothetical protein